MRERTRAARTWAATSGAPSTFKETLSLQELSLTNCGAVGGSVRVFQKEHSSKLKDLRVARVF